MLRSIAAQPCGARPVPITVRATNVAKPLALARGRREVDLVSVAMVVPVGAGSRGKEGPQTILFPRACESLAYRSCLVDRDHAGAPPPRYVATELPRLTKPK